MPELQFTLTVLSPASVFTWISIMDLFTAILPMLSIRIPSPLPASYAGTCYPGLESTPDEFYFILSCLQAQGPVSR